MIDFGGVFDFVRMHMTDQIPDSILLRGVKHLMVRSSGKGAFNPAAHGLYPGFSMNSGCRRGFLCTYSLKGDALVLDELDIHLNEESPLPLGDIQPVEGRIGWLYSNLGISVPYSGTMLVGAGFEPRHYAGNGAFDRPYCYRILRELSFVNGELVSERDCSGMFESERQEHEAEQQRAIDKFAVVIEPISPQKKPEPAIENRERSAFWSFIFGPKQ